MRQKQTRNHTKNKEGFKFKYLEKCVKNRPGIRQKTKKALNLNIWKNASKINWN